MSSLETWTSLLAQGGYRAQLEPNPRWVKLAIVGRWRSRMLASVTSTQALDKQRESQLGCLPHQPMTETLHQRFSPVSLLQNKLFRPRSITVHILFKPSGVCGPIVLESPKDTLTYSTVVSFLKVSESMDLGFRGVVVLQSLIVSPGSSSAMGLKQRHVSDQRGL